MSYGLPSINNGKKVDNQPLNDNEDRVAWVYFGGSDNIPLEADNNKQVLDNKQVPGGNNYHKKKNGYSKNL